MFLTQEQGYFDLSVSSVTKWDEGGWETFKYQREGSFLSSKGWKVSFESQKS